MEFRPGANDLYIVRPLNFRAVQFERINTTTGKIEGVYPLAVAAHQAAPDNLRELVQNPQRPAFNFYSVFSVDRSGERIAAVGWSPTTLGVLQPLMEARGLESRSARRLHLIYQIDTKHRRLSYHEVHDRSELSLRWMQWLQFVDDRLFFMQERDLKEGAHALYEVRNGSPLIRAQLSGLVMQIRIARSGRLFAYASRSVREDANPAVFLTVQDFDGKTLVQVGPRDLYQAFSTHLNCNDFYTSWMKQ